MTEGPSRQLPLLPKENCPRETVAPMPISRLSLSWSWVSSQFQSVPAVGTQMFVGTTLRPEMVWDGCSRAWAEGHTHIRNMGSSGSTPLMKRNILILAPGGSTPSLIWAQWPIRSVLQGQGLRPGTRYWSGLGLLVLPRRLLPQLPPPTPINLII